MSSTNKTATIELSQYIGTDKPTYLTDYNGDMLKIDNAIAADRDSIATAQNTADGADRKADANKDSIDTLNAEINGDPSVPSQPGLADRVTDVEGDINTIESLIGNGTPTTTDHTIIGAINELHTNQGDLSNLTTTEKSSLVGAINEIAGGGSGGSTSASNVTYDNTSSGLTADDVQEALDEIVAALPTAGAIELQSGTLTAGQTSVVLTFTEQTVGATSLIDVYVEDGINYTAIATASTTVTLTFESQAADKAVAVRVTN